MKFSYLHNGTTHSDYSPEYMITLGLPDYIQESVLSQLAQHNLKIVKAEQDWVIERMNDADKSISKHLDGDARATSTEQAWRGYRKELRNYVKCGVVIGIRPTEPT